MFHKIPKEQNLIVILDDDKDVQFSLDSLLRSVVFTTLVFSSTDEFLTMPLPPQACCMLLDVKLGNVNGLDFLEEMAQRGLTLPVIIITGHGDIPMAVRGIKSGATDFLSKPYKDTVLLNAIADLLEKWRNNQESQEKKNKRLIITRR
ncbi:MAG: response regulator [Acetobacter orientalis]|uniref:response regulator transcription factor n=1 Tax=Acetobacter orientalis TaxID=146474 RepID=UPI0039ED7D35